MRRYALALALAAVVAVGLLSWVATRRADGPADAPTMPTAPPTIAAHRVAPAFDRLVLVPGRARVSPSNEASVSGRVVSRADGRGVASADVGFLFEGAVSTVVTTESGAFRFTAPSSGTYKLASVEADGFFPFVAYSGWGLVSFRLKAGVAIEGLVLELAPRIWAQSS